MAKSDPEQLQLDDGTLIDIQSLPSGVQMLIRNISALELEYDQKQDELFCLAVMINGAKTELQTMLSNQSYSNSSD